MHEGHRKRLLEKLKDGSTLYEHELLEILLFNAYPRKNVNPVAHALLQRFSSMREVLSASVEELCAVDGVGENVALYLKCVGECIKFGDKNEGFAVINNVDTFKDFIKCRFNGKSCEFFELYLLDKNGRVKRICTFSSGEANKVQLNTEEIIKVVSVYRPHGIFVAHNHIGCSAEPSEADDELTRSMLLICRLNNVRLYDHCIYVSDDEIFSYYLSDRIINMQSDASIDRLIKNGK